MIYSVIDTDIDGAGKFRVRVEIGGSTIMFKFDEAPTDEEVQAQAARYDALIQEQANAAPDSD